MPSKKKRVASRQAQLSQRRRRERNRGRREDAATGPAVNRQTIAADAGAQPEASGAPGSVAPAPVAEPSVDTAEVVQPAQPRQRGPARRRGAAARIEPVPTYPYLRAEVRHIGIVTGVIVALLIALTVLLR